MDLDCFLDLVMMEVVSNKTCCPLLAHSDGGIFLSFGKCAMVGVVIGDLLFTNKVQFRTDASIGRR